MVYEATEALYNKLIGNILSYFFILYERIEVFFMRNRKSLLAIFLAAVMLCSMLLSGCKKDVKLDDVSIQGVSTTLEFQSPVTPKETKTPPKSGPNKQFISKNIATEGHNDYIQVMAVCIGYDANKVKKITRKEFQPDINQTAEQVMKNVAKNYKEAADINMADATTQDGHAAKLITFSYTSKSDTRLNSQMLYFFNGNDLWAVEVNTKDGDDDAKSVADKVIQSVK